MQEAITPLDSAHSVDKIGGKCTGVEDVAGGDGADVVCVIGVDPSEAGPGGVAVFIVDDRAAVASQIDRGGEVAVWV